jgi:hypothetical protein
MRRNDTIFISILFAIVCFPFLLMAQQEPHFITTLYFEDAVGNRDSIEYGYDYAATEDMDAAFGEYELTTPFDSVFEVRAGTPDFTYRQKLTKRFVAGTEVVVDDTCWSGGGGYIYVHAIHQPVAIRWRKEDFLSNICYRGAFVVNHIEFELAGPIAPEDIAQEYYCLAAQDSAVFELSEDALTPDLPRIYIEKEVEGSGMTKIWGLNLPIVPAWAYTPCFWVTNTRSAASHSVRLYPNPAGAVVRLDLPPEQCPERVTIRSMAGRVISLPALVGNEIDTSALPAGMYLLEWTDAQGDRFMGRVVKQ